MGKAKAKPTRRDVRDTEPGLVISVGWQYDGGVYGLDPRSKRRIREVFPDALINPGILFGYDKTEDYNRFHRPHWETLAQILTGLTPEQIGQLGGVYIYDPMAETILWRWDPQKEVKRR
jgi:hypothetical protein